MYTLSGDQVHDISPQVFECSSIIFQIAKKMPFEKFWKRTDALVVMHTGGSKALCYAILTIISKSFTIFANNDWLYG